MEQELVINDLFSQSEIDVFGAAIHQNAISQMGADNKYPNQTKRILIVVDFFNQFQLISDAKNLFWYHNNYYQLISEKKVKKLVKMVFIAAGWDDYKTRVGGEIYSQLFVDMDVDSYQIDNYPSIIPFKNGNYNMSEGKLDSPSPEIYFTKQFSVDCNESDDCPKFKKFMGRILPYEKPRRQVLTYLSYCFTTRIDVQITQIWTGEGDNGKTTLSQLIKRIMGGFISHIPLKRLMNENDRFSKSHLMGKWLNIGSEIKSSRKFKETGIDDFKELITNEWLYGEKKGDAPAEWKNYTKFLFELNKLPLQSAYMDFAFYRRLQIIPFTQIIEEEEKIKGLHDILYDEEGPQIVAYILSHYKLIDEVLKQDAALAEKLWRLNTHSVFLFVSTYYFIGRGMASFPKDVFNKYLGWCKLLRKKPVNMDTFENLLKSQGAEKYQERDYETQRFITRYSMELKEKDGTIDAFMLEGEIKT